MEVCFKPDQIRYVPGETLQTPELLAAALEGATGWLVGREEVSEAVLSRLSSVPKVIAKYGVGLDNVDLQACAKRNIKLAWEAGVNREAVAEHTLGLMLAVCRRIGISSRYLAQGEWRKNGGCSLSGRKVGIIGLGHIGKHLAELLKAFNCSLAYCDIVPQETWALGRGITRLDFTALLSWAEVLSFHVPLTPLTYHMLNFSNFEKTRPGVYIFNTSRGSVIDQEALKSYLRNGHVAGAGLDVFENEPLRDKALFSLENVVLTPHTAGNSQEAIMAMGQAAILGLQKVLG